MAFQINSSEVITTFTTANPTGVSITVPSGCNAVYVFWSYLHFSDVGVLTFTLDGNSASESFEGTYTTGNRNGGVLAWYSPTTGSPITLDPEFDTAPQEGASCTVVYVQEADTGGWRDADGSNTAGTTANSVTLTTVSGDIVIKHDSSDGDQGAPALSSGWSNLQNGVNNFENYRTSYISAGGSSQACDSENDSYSQVVAVAIKDGSSAGGPYTIEIPPAGTPY